MSTSTSRFLLSLKPTLSSRNSQISMPIVPEFTAPASSTAQLLIDEKIAHLKECIRHLKSQRNGLTPISGLPPEVLGTIFSFTSAGRTPTSPIFPCYYFTHVSRSWREVALNTPNLWQVLPDAIPWATVMLERSKGADLVVASNLSSSCDHRRVSFLKEVLTKHALRIRELDLFNGIETSYLTSLFENVHQPQLRLRSLKLASTDSVFPIGVIETGHLRRLVVIRCGGPWWSLLLPPLTHLRLRRLSDRPPLVKFLEMLRGLHTLEVLDMDDSLPLAQDSVGSIRPIELPRLNRLYLESSSDPKEVTNLLPIIIVPPTTFLRFDVGTQPSATVQQIDIIRDELASSVSTFLGQDTGFSYRNLNLFSDRHGHLRLRAWKDDGWIPVTPHLKLEVSLRSLYPVQNVLQAILPSLPLFNMTTLTLEMVPSRMILDATFGRLPYLQNVNLVGDRTIEFIEALRCKPENYNTEHAYYSVSFPALQSLGIRKFSFTKHRMCQIQDCLMERYERRAELLKLKLTNCPHLWVQDVESLRDIVNDVEWDGLTIFCPSVASVQI